MMRILTDWRFPVWLALLALLFGCTPSTALRQHPEFDESRKHIERIVVLPPIVNVERIMFSGDNETLDSQEESFPLSLTAQARTILHTHGYLTCDVELIELALDNQDLAFQIEQIKNAYNAASEKLYDKSVPEDDYKHFRASIGPVVNSIADMANADALLLVKYEGITKSDGEMQKEIAANLLLSALTGVYYQPIKSVSAIEVAIIDGYTGDILWVNTHAKIGLSTIVISGALNQIPDGAMQEQIAKETAEREAAAEEIRQETLSIPAESAEEILSQPASWE